MSILRFGMIAGVSVAIGILALGNVRAGEEPEGLAPPPRVKKDREGPRRPPPKPPREDDFDRPDAPPGDDAGPPPPRPKEDGDQPRPRPNREHGDREGPPPPRGGQGPSRGDRSPPSGPPRWPHANWESLEQNDPEMYGLLKADSELDRQEREMAMRYRQAPREQREKILAAIHETVNKHFEVRQQRRAMELKRLETELQRLREAIQRREKARKELVQRRAAELVGREDELPF